MLVHGAEGQMAANGGVLNRFVTAMDRISTWWVRRLVDSVCVWDKAMRHPVSIMLPSAGVLPQVVFVLVFALLPLFRVMLTRSR